MEDSPNFTDMNLLNGWAVKVRTTVTRGAGSPAAAVAMVFNLVDSAQGRWRAITGAHLVALVRSATWFENGILVELSEAAA